MTHLLDLIERVVPRMRLYPRWAQRLFALTFAMTLTSFFLWVVMAPAASHNAQHAAVQLDIGVAAQLAPNRIGPRTEDVVAAPIAYELDPRTRTIAPDVPYLRLVRSGGPLGGIDEIGFEAWSAAATLPKLEVTLANTGSTKVYLTSATVHVARSTPDLEPVPVVFRGIPGTPRRFTIENEGWGRLRGATLAYAVAAGRVAPRFSATYPYAARLGSVGDSVEVSVARGIAAAKLAPHGEATVWGELTYTWRDAGGRTHRQSDRVVTTVYLESGMNNVGSMLTGNDEYAVYLRMSGRNYDVDVAGFRRYIDPKTPDLFRLRLTTPRSSSHTGVTVRLHYSDGHVQSSKPLALKIFQPRNAPQN